MQIFFFCWSLLFQLLPDARIVFSQFIICFLCLCCAFGLNVSFFCLFGVGEWEVGGGTQGRASKFELV